MRKTFAELLTLHTAEERGTDAEIKKRIHAVAKVRIAGRLTQVAQEPEPHSNIFQLLPEPVKATEFIRKLSAQMLGDPNLLRLMEKVVDQDTSCAECMQAVVSYENISLSCKCIEIHCVVLRDKNT